MGVAKVAMVTESLSSVAKAQHSKHNFVYIDSCGAPVSLKCYLFYYMCPCHKFEVCLCDHTIYIYMKHIYEVSSKSFKHCIL